MKIVYLFKSLANKGGTERILIDKMNYLAAKSSYEVYAITYEQGEHPYAYPLSPTVKHADLNCRFFTLRKYNPAKRLMLAVKLFQQYKKSFNARVREIQPDMVVCTTYSYADIYLTMNLPANIKTIIESHVAKSSIEYGRKTTGPISTLLGGVDRYIFKKMSRCSALVTLTQADAEAWKSVKEAIVIPDYTSYYPEHVDIPKESKTIISVGRLDNQQKGYDLLIEAWSKVHPIHPDWSINIYGSGGDKDKILEQIQRNNLQDSVFLHEATDRIYDKYQENAFYVMSSRYEGFALVLAEAMCCGLPCISFDCPYGPSDVIRDKEDGLLVEPENTTALAENICYLIENKEVRKTMGLKARENIKRYLPENVMPLWEKMFECLMFNV